MESLINILKRAKGQLEEGWLYLPNNEIWDANTKGIVIDIDELDESQVDQDDEPVFAKENNLKCTLDSGTIEGIVEYASNLDEPLTEELLLESFLYYYDYDAFLPESGFKPLPPDEHLLKIDRDFYDCLGEERKDVVCRHETCSRGAIKGSVLCKIHHFEMMQKKQCPFTD